MEIVLDDPKNPYPREEKLCTRKVVSQFEFFARGGVELVGRGKSHV